MTFDRQAEYEHRRRSRLLGLAIDQTLTGVKNIIVYSDTKFWEPEDKERWDGIRNAAEEILRDLMSLEKEMVLTNATIYATLVVNNPELHTTVIEDKHEDPTKDKNRV